MTPYIHIIKKMLTEKLTASEKIELSESEPMKKLLSAQWDEPSDWYAQDKVDSDEIWDNIISTCWPTEAIEDKPKKKKYFNMRYSIAAAIILAIVGVWIAQVMNDPYLTVSAPAGEKLAWVLPDSSTVWLNSGSKIKYPKEFVEDRTVELTGEAYFSVVKKVASPFKVLLPEAYVEVKGTEFNVQLNPTTYQITLFTGSIVFSPEKQQQNVEMRPSEQLVYDVNSHQVNIEKVAPEEFDWRTDEYRFTNKPFGELLQFINRMYKVNIVVKDHAIEKELFSGKIQKSEPLSDVLNKMCISFDLKQEKKNDQFIILY